MDYSRLLHQVCRLTVSPSYLRERRHRAEHTGMAQAVRDRDTSYLFAWLVEVFSYQGIADARASGYMDAHGRLTWADVAQGLNGCPACLKLKTYWHFEGCGYAKTAGNCAEPVLLPTCPLPRHDLRNGRLNQMAYALFLFIQDICRGDLVGWIDARLVEADDPGAPNRAFAMRAALLDPLSRIYGISFKVLAMALSELLLAGDPTRERWVSTGAAMVAVDTLVHNWLHRTGIARQLGHEHPYGRLCYEPGGCAEILEDCSREIDAQALCRDGPAYFPRLVQHAVWHFCAESGLDLCNGNRINDRIGCMQVDCPLFAGRAKLSPT